jgi:uncharacterized protein YbjT (DUF2867 family)
MKNNVIAVAGANGNLGRKIITHLITSGADVRALIRKGRLADGVHFFQDHGVKVFEVDFDNPLSLVDACLGCDVVVSALSGVRNVIVDAQTNLVNAAVEAKVKRFIPSDYCIDYRKLKSEDNRNLALRREFSKILDRTPIRSTSVLNGMFTDLLLKGAPVILFKQKRIFFWGNGDQKMDFTTIDNTAEFTAAVACDNDSPRWLTVAGDVASMHDLVGIASEVTGNVFKTFRPGGLAAFRAVIKVTRLLAPGKEEPFPAWQGMQYLYDMLSGIPKFTSLDNTRYPEIKWTKIKDVIAAG